MFTLNSTDSSKRNNKTYLVLKGVAYCLKGVAYSLKGVPYSLKGDSYSFRVEKLILIV